MNPPSFPNVDLLSEGINALNGVLVAPSRNRGHALVGLRIMSFVGGIRGGVSHDILLNDIPSPVKDPKYILVCILMGLLGVCNPRRAQGSGSSPGNLQRDHDRVNFYRCGGVFIDCCSVRPRQPHSSEEDARVAREG